MSTADQVGVGDSFYLFSFTFVCFHLGTRGKILQEIQNYVKHSLGSKKLKHSFWLILQNFGGAWRSG